MSAAPARAPPAAMSFYRALSKQLIKSYAGQRTLVPWYQQPQTLTPLQQWYKVGCLSRGISSARSFL